MSTQHQKHSFNDDDLYLIDLSKRRVITSYGASSESARAARSQGIPVKPGQALLKDMQAKHMELT